MISILLFYLSCKVINKGSITERDFLVLCFSLLLGLFFLLLSFIKRDIGFTTLSIVAITHFITEELLIKYYNINEN